MRTFQTSIVLVSCLLLLTSGVPAHALTFAEISGRGEVLGDSVSGVYPYPTGSLVNDSGTIYFVKGANKIPFTKWSAFVGLGYSLKNVVKGNLNNYTLEPNYTINSAGTAHPWGQWLSYKNIVYYSTQQGLLAAPSAEIFTNNGGRWNLVVKANKYDLAALKANNSLLLSDNDPRIISAPAYSFGSTPGSLPESAATSAAPAPSAAAQAPTPAPAPAAAFTGTLNQPTLSASSPAGQYVLFDALNQSMAAFNFTAENGPVAVTELDFTIQTNISLWNSPPISQIFVANGSATVFPGGATTSVAGLDISVPTGSAGTNVTVTADLAAINPYYFLSNQPFALKLVGVKYLSNGQTVFLNTDVTSNPMSLVGGFPTISISSPPAGGMTDGLVELASITVGVAGGGSIILTQIPLVLTATGNVLANDDANNLFVTGNSAPVTTTNDAFGFSAGTSTAAVTLTLSDNNLINAGVPKTYNIFLQMGGRVNISAGPSTVTTSLGNPSGLIFDDSISGANGTNISGSVNGISLTNYPTNAAIIHN
jgi:hypothetical protein